MPEAEAEQPEFQKRPLWEYKDGEEVDGTVAALRQRAVFVDVGAMVDAYFPEENWGAMKGKMEVGQKLKFRIEKVTGCRMTLTEAWAKPRSGKMCRLHGLDWDESAGAIASIQHCPAHWGLLMLYLLALRIEYGWSRPISRFFKKRDTIPTHRINQDATWYYIYMSFSV